MIESLGYRGWQGRRRSSWWACWSLVRTGVLLVLRRKLFWLLLGVGMFHFLFAFGVIYLKAQLTSQGLPAGNFLDRIVLTGSGQAYLEFMLHQGVVTMILLAFAGSLLIGADYQHGGLAFYLSRGIGRRHYVVGKLLAIGTIVELITALPAVLLFIDYGAMSSSFEYFTENWRILLGIAGYGLVLGVTMSLLLAAVASWVPRTVPLVMIWAGIFVFLPAVAESLRHLFDDRIWRLLNLRHDLYLLGKWCFGSVEWTGDEGRLAGWAVWIVPALCVVCLGLFLRRVKAVEVVQ